MDQGELEKPTGCLRAALTLLRWVATDQASVKPLFLAAPARVWQAFLQAVSGELDNATLERWLAPCKKLG